LPRVEKRLAIRSTAIVLIVWTCAALVEMGLGVAVVEEVCALPLVDTVAGNEAAGVDAGNEATGVEATGVEVTGVEAASVGNEAAVVEAASVEAASVEAASVKAASVKAASVDTAAAVVGTADSEGQQPSEPSESWQHCSEEGHP
jgi:hypothetical protein